MDLVDIGTLLKQARREKGLTQTQLASDASLTRSRVAAIENGTAGEVGIKYLVRALNAVGLDLRVTTLNEGRPTYDDLVAENEAEDRRASRMG